ncbi:MAG: hypothetical protein C4560_08575 [Nitrospiraceae bacterium]|nr:MAG: hypothetical protein C4560_08575 [Nitrospiraceae bacterium]
MLHKFDIYKIIAALRKISIVSNVEILLIDEIEHRGFYKLRGTLVPSKFKLDIKYISTEKDILYSYQLYTDEAVARWDNEPHYPGFNNYPHHLHYKENIGASVLSGNPIHDVNKICSFVKEIIGNI